MYAAAVLCVQFKTNASFLKVFCLVFKTFTFGFDQKAKSSSEVYLCFLPQTSSLPKTLTLMCMSGKSDLAPSVNAKGKVDRNSHYVFCTITAC